MKNKKKFFSVLVLSIFLCVVFVIGCSNGDNDNNVNVQGGDTETGSTQSTDSFKDGTEESTGVVLETEAVESTEEIEATEETETEEKELPDEAESALKEDEEILKITPTNDNVNNGSGSNEKEVYNAPAAATRKNPIIKVTTGKEPIAFSSGEIPAGKTWYYKVTATKGKYLCIEDKDATIICEDKSVKVNDEGKVLLKIPEVVTEIGIKNGSKSAKSFKVSVIEIEKLVGTKDDPEVITSIATNAESARAITSGLEAGDEDGYYYTWTATADAELDFTVATTSLSSLKYDLIITVKDVVAKMSESGEFNEDKGEVTTTVSVAKGDKVLIQIIAKKDGETYPTVEKVSFTPICRVAGSKDNPIVLVFEEPERMVDVKVAAGKTVYYHSYGIGGAELSIGSANVNVIYKEKTYEPKGAVVSVPLEETANNREPVSFAVKNTGTAETTYTLKVAFEEGSANNPSQIVIVEGNNIVVNHDFVEGDKEYYYQWKAPADGIMSFDISNTTSVGWQYGITSELKGIADGPYDSVADDANDQVVPTKEYTVNKDDVFIIKVCTYALEEPTIPAGKINFKLSFDETTRVETVDAAIEDSFATDKVVVNTDLDKMQEADENTEFTENTEVVENTEAADVTETEEAVEEETLEDSETMEVFETIALRLIRNWCLRLFSR